MLAALLAINVFWGVRVVAAARPDMMERVALAGGAALFLSLLLVSLSGSARKATCVCVVLLGLDGVASMILLNPWWSQTETQEWALLPAFLSTLALGITLLVVLVGLFIASGVRARRQGGGG